MQLCLSSEILKASLVRIHDKVYRLQAAHLEKNLLSCRQPVKELHYHIKFKMIYNDH